MRFPFFLLAFFSPTLLFASESPAPSSLSDQFFGLPITNTLFTGWVVAILFLVGLRIFVGKAKMIPGRGQAVLESAVTGLRDLWEPIVGKKAMPVAFPILITLFFFILIQNWTGLIPGVGTIGWGTGSSPLHVHVETPLFRPPTSDLNGTIALAAFSFLAWILIILKYAGPKVILLDWFGNKADKKELAAPMYWALSVIFLLVGVIEIVSILIRPITLSVRLFGNVFGGENLMHATSYSLPFYFMELLVGFVQALVFTLLSAVYIGLLCNHGDHDEEEAHAH